MYIKDAKFLARGLLFALICFFPLWLPLVMPLGFFNFRVWEAVSFYRFGGTVPFYPNVGIQKIEEGDLGHATKFAVPKSVVWQTDRYGYRNSPMPDDCEAVIVGDSNLAGIGLSQNETLSSVLSQKTRRCVYALAPADINTFLSSRRFIEHPPQVVILESIERSLYLLPEVKPQTVTAAKVYWRPVGWIVQKADEFLKLSFVRYVQAKVNLFFHPKRPLANEDAKMLFFQDSLDSRKLNLDNYRHIQTVLSGYRQALDARGIKFIFLPVPDKENVYCGLLPKDKCVDDATRAFLSALTKDLNDNRIQTLDLQSVFLAESGNRYPLYALDDTHWSPAGVELAAKLLAGSLGRQSENANLPVDGGATALK